MKFEFGDCVTFNSSNLGGIFVNEDFYNKNSTNLGLCIPSHCVTNNRNKQYVLTIDIHCICMNKHSFDTLLKSIEYGYDGAFTIMIVPEEYIKKSEIIGLHEVIYSNFSTELDNTQSIDMHYFPNKLMLVRNDNNENWKIRNVTHMYLTIFTKSIYVTSESTKFTQGILYEGHEEYLDTNLSAPY